MRNTMEVKELMNKISDKVLEWKKFKQEKIKENLKLLEEGLPLNMPLAFLNGKFKKRVYGNSDKMKEYNKEYRKSDKYKQYLKSDKYKQMLKKYYKKNKKRLREYRKKYYLRRYKNERTI